MEGATINVRQPRFALREDVLFPALLPLQNVEKAASTLIQTHSTVELVITNVPRESLVFLANVSLSVRMERASAVVSVPT